MRLEKIGTVWSRSRSRNYAFLIDEGEEIRTNEYVLAPHPLNLGTYLLGKTYDVVKENPFLEKVDMFALLLRKYDLKDISEQEAPLALVSTYGYFKGKRWKHADVTPGTGQPVYRATKEMMEQYHEGREGLVQVGKFRDFDLANEIDIDMLPQHMFVCGMTGSGKTTFVLNLLSSILEKYAYPHILVLDTKGDYKVLEELGAQVIPYYEVKPVQFPSAEDYVKALYMDPKTKTGRIVNEAVEALLRQGKTPTAREVEILVEEITPHRVARKGDVEGYIKRIKWALDQYGERFEVERKPKDVREVLEHPLTIVDFSCDSNVRDWQEVGREIFNRSFEIAQSGEVEGIMLVVEETQWWAPERGFGVGDPTASRVAMSQTMSQARSFGLCYVPISQRPQSVTKAVISQCGTYVCFRVRNPNDHRQIRESSEYPITGAELSGLDDHEGLLFGAASPWKFPVSFYTDPKIFPARAGKRISKSWGRKKEVWEFV